MDEFNAAGQRIYRHTAPVDAPPVERNELLRSELARFYTAQCGAQPDVFAEKVPEGFYLDLLIFPPTAQRPFQTVVTSGMSELAMAVPEGAEAWSRCELVMTLPPSWPLAPRPDGSSPLDDENYYWPLRLLKDLARMPLRYETWVGYGHTIQNGDPVEPYAPRTRLEAALLADATTLRETQIYTHSGTVWFYGVYPIYGSEMELKLHSDANALFDKLHAAGIIEGVPNPVRPPVA